MTSPSTQRRTAHKSQSSVTDSREDQQKQHGMLLRLYAGQDQLFSLCASCLCPAFMLPFKKYPGAESY